MSEYILDASALLALMFTENGRDRVLDILDQAVIGRINATEVLTKLLEKGASLSEAKQNFDDLNLTIVDFNESVPQNRRTSVIHEAIWPLTR